jgi:hypothetical protein
VDLNGANLSEATLRKTDLRKADLSDANLRKANLSEADLFKADLSEANLREVTLSAGTLLNANLVDTDLTGADLTGCRIFGKRLLSTPPAHPARSPGEKLGPAAPGAEIWEFSHQSRRVNAAEAAECAIFFATRNLLCYFSGSLLTRWTGPGLEQYRRSD